MLVFRLLMRSRGFWAILTTASLLFCGGCGSDGYSGPTGTVSGTVTLNGEAVPDGSAVTFISDQGFTASGKVSGGKYQLSVTKQDGRTTPEVPAAAYIATVTPPATGGESSAEDYDGMMDKESTSGGGGRPKKETAREAIPAKYQDTGTSGLSYNVKEEPNTINIALE